MPVTYEFDDCIVILRMRGVYAPADIQRAFLRAVADQACPEIVGMLFDVRGSESLPGRSAGEVRAMARFLGAHAAEFGRRLAIVADTDAAFGLMRLGAVDVEQLGVDSRVFRSAAEADRWLKPHAPAPNASSSLQPEA
jgi:hypothetical protein